MWKRKDLKTKAKKNLKKNYWAAIGVCFILAFIGIEYSDSVSLIHETSDNKDNYTIIKEMKNEDTSDVKLEAQVPQNAEETVKFIFQNMTSSASWIFKMFAGGGYIIGAIVILLFMFLFCYPISVGAKRFFIKNRESKPNVLEVFSVFKKNKFFNIVYIMFFKYILNMLWTFLFIIPGIIKYYQYRMIPYILAENPNIKRKRAFEISKEMMKGNKWKTFVLEMSFILWNFLSSLTFGLVGIFFVNPYNAATFAELYNTLKENLIQKGIITSDELKAASLIEEVE